MHHDVRMQALCYTKDTLYFISGRRIPANRRDSQIVQAILDIDQSDPDHETCERTKIEVLDLLGWKASRE